MRNLDFKQVEIDTVIIHGIGNRTKEEDNFYSTEQLELDEAQKSILMSYYLAPFKKEEYFQFIGNTFMGNTDETDSNQLYNSIKGIHKFPELFVEHSRKIAELLHQVTTHPKIISGELHIVKFSNIIYKDEIISAIGLFKSETTESYIKSIQQPLSINIERQEGMGIKKLDRACLILNTDKKDGYRILNVDKTKGEANPHWTNDFLVIERRKESFFQTVMFIRMAVNFADEALIEENEIDISSKVQYLQNTESFLKNTEIFEFDEFKEIVLSNDKNIIKVFDKSKKDFEDDFDIELGDKFEISNDAIKENTKEFKTTIKLDDNFKISIDGDADEIELGFDEARDKKFYKVYFTEEI